MYFSFFTPDFDEIKSWHMALTACKLAVSGSISLAYHAFFSPFPRGTSSLSVGSEYLALDDGPPRFRQGFSCPVLLGIPTGLS